MTANILRDSKIVSIHLPAGKSAMAGVLSYLGIEHKDENDLSCYGSNEMGIQVMLEYTGIAERNIAELCRNEGISLGRLNSAYQFLESLPYEQQIEVMDKVASQRPGTFSDFRHMLDSSVIPTVVTKFYFPLAVTLYVRNRWGDLDENGYEEDGRFAARYADEIREMMKAFNADDGENMAAYFYGSNALLKIKGKFLLSYNDCPEIRELYAKDGIMIESTTRLSNIAQRYDAGKQYPELLISNYDTYEERILARQLTLFDHIEEPEKILKEHKIIWKSNVK